MQKIKADVLIYVLLFSLITAFFWNFHGINTGNYTDSYIIYRIVHNFKLLFIENASNIYNENIGYPLFIFFFTLLGISIEMSAVLVNYVFFIIGLIYFYKLALIISKNRIASLITTLFLFVNPIVQYWLLRTMADTVFMNLLIVFVYYSFKEKEKIIFFLFFIMLFVRSESVLLIPYILFYRKENIKNRIILLMGLVLTYFLIIFNFKNGGKVNFILFYKTIMDIPFFLNLKNHLKSLIYIFRFSGIIFFISGLVYLVRFEKKDYRYLRIFYLLTGYLGMNIIWKFVQFRHWLPFIPFFIIIFVFFFKYLVDESLKHSKGFFVILMMLTLYTLNDVYAISNFRINSLKNAFNDNHQAGLYIKDLEADIIISNIDESMSFFNDKVKYIRLDEYEWIPKVLEECGKNKKIYAVLADRKFITRLEWKEVFKEIKVFKTKYNFYYPSVPGFRVENSWDWELYKGKEINQKTRVFEFNQRYFLLSYALKAYDSKNYKQSVFYFQKLLKEIKKQDEEVLKHIKICYYMIALQTENKGEKEEYVKKALDIDVYNEININLKHLIEKR